MNRIAFVLTALFSTASALELTSDNYDQLTTGKPVFLKMYAPWCGHCKRLAPTWEQLELHYTDSRVLVASVDCTTGGKAICDANGVRGFPTLKFGDPNALEDYQGGRDFESLNKFARDIEAQCSAFNPDKCDDLEAGQLDHFMSKDLDELRDILLEKETLLKKVEGALQDEVKKLQEAYEELKSSTEDAIQKIKSQGYGLLKSVIKFKEREQKRNEL